MNSQCKNLPCQHHGWGPVDPPCTPSDLHLPYPSLPACSRFPCTQGPPTENNQTEAQVKGPWKPHKPSQAASERAGGLSGRGEASPLQAEAGPPHWGVERPPGTAWLLRQDSLTVPRSATWPCKTQCPRQGPGWFSKAFFTACHSLSAWTCDTLPKESSSVHKWLPGPIPGPCSTSLRESLLFSALCQLPVVLTGYCYQWSIYPKV